MYYQSQTTPTQPSHQTDVAVPSSDAWHWTHHPVPTTGNNGLGVAGFVCGLTGLGLVCGIVSLLVAILLLAAFA